MQPEKTHFGIEDIPDLIDFIAVNQAGQSPSEEKDRGFVFHVLQRDDAFHPRSDREIDEKIDDVGFLVTGLR